MNDNSNVVILPVVTTLDTPADRILEAAIGKLDVCVIIGFDSDGQEHFASNRSDAAEVIYHLERTKHKLMKIVDGDY